MTRRGPSAPLSFGERKRSRSGEPGETGHAGGDDTAFTHAKPAAAARLRLSQWRAVDVYELSVDLRPGVRDLEFTAVLERYLGELQADGLIEGWRLLRSKLGLGAASEFKVLIETRDLAQLDTAFTASRRATSRSRVSTTVSTRSSPTSAPRCGETFPTPSG